MNRFHRHFRRSCATLVGIVFLVSGILKLWDPVGTMLIVTEYFKFLSLPGFIPAAKGVGIGLALLECVVGIGLITGVLRKASAIAAFALTSVFTLLTLFLWIYDAPMDCGCFGQAIHLTHAQSFWKNVILLALCLIAFVPFRELGRAKTHRGVAAALATLVVIIGAIHCNLHLPIVDFTAFNWGSQLFSSLGDEAEDVDYRNAPILSFSDESGAYCDDLAASGKVVVFSVYDPSKADWDRLEEQYRAVAATQALPLVLVSGTQEDVVLPPDVQPYFCDYKTLITLNRSNGGGTYFYYGELIHKWSAGHFPSEIDEDMADDPIALSTRHITRRRVTAQGFCVILAAILILV